MNTSYVIKVYFTLNFFLQNTLWFLRSKWITEEWFCLTWNKWFEIKRVEYMEWYKKSKEVKETPEFFNICNLPNNFFEKATKKAFKLTKENQNIEENRVLLIKLLMLFNFWFNQMEKLIAAVKFFLLRWYIKLQHICKFITKFFLVYLKLILLQ